MHPLLIVRIKLKPAFVPDCIFYHPRFGLVSRSQASSGVDYLAYEAKKNSAVERKRLFQSEPHLFSLRRVYGVCLTQALS